MVLVLDAPIPVPDVSGEGGEGLGGHGVRIRPMNALLPHLQRDHDMTPGSGPLEPLVEEQGEDLHVDLLDLGVRHHNLRLASSSDILL